VGGVFVASILLVRRVAHFVTVTRRVSGGGEDRVARYTVEGELFFASSNDLTQFEYSHDPSGS
jgi:SulP family sulfate permease